MAADGPSFFVLDAEDGSILKTWTLLGESGFKGKIASSIALRGNQMMATFGDQ